MAVVTVTGTTRYTLTETNPSGQQVTGYQLLFGAVSGTYTLTSAVPASDMTATGASGLWSDILPQPNPGTWYCVGEAVNASGNSLPSSPPIQVTITLPVPSAPLLSAV